MPKGIKGFQKGHIVSEEQKRKLSEARKGVKLTEEHKRKLSENSARPMLGKHHTEESKEKNRQWHLGKKQSKETIKKRVRTRTINGSYKHSEETKKKMSIKRRINNPGGFKKGCIVSEETRKKMSEDRKGEKGPNWQGGISSKNHIIRQSIDIRLWREAVFARDNWTCQKTGIKGGKLTAHHIQNFAQYPELRFAIDNGITLSFEIHREFHNIYGRKNNTKEQIIEFLNI